jgi:acetolactate synthase regulatory subunit
MSADGARPLGNAAEPEPRADERAAIVLVRVHDRPGALERVLGLLRRRALGARPFALINGTDQDMELALRVDERRTSRQRVRLELLALHDVRDVAVYVTETRTKGEE